MVPYIKKVLTEFPERITGVFSLPTADHLFQVLPPLDAKLLPAEQAQVFHHTTAQLLFLSCVHRDIQTTIAFLTTQSRHQMKMIGGNSNESSNTSLVLAIFVSLCRLTLFLTLLVCRCITSNT